MEKKLFRRITLVTFLCVLASSVLFSCVLLSLNRSNIDRTSLAVLKTAAISFSEDTDPVAFCAQLSRSYPSMRVSIINRQGTVLADSQVDEETLENHLNRPEVQGAFAMGYSTASRYSASLNKEARYNAYLVNEDIVIRLMIPQTTFWEIFRPQLSLLAFCFALCMLVGAILARRTVSGFLKPIQSLTSSLELTGELREDHALSYEGIYDELLPLVRAVNFQHACVRRAAENSQQQLACIQQVLEKMHWYYMVVSLQGDILQSNALEVCIFDKASAHPTTLYEFCSDAGVLQVFQKLKHNREAAKQHCAYQNKTSGTSWQICMCLTDMPKTQAEPFVLITFSPLTQTK